MAIALFTVLIISLILTFFVRIKWDQEKAELTQKIDYLNNNLNEENLTTFSVTRSFDVQRTFNASIPKIVFDDRNMKNPAYKRAVLNLEAGQRTANRTTAFLLILTAILAIVIIFFFPEYVNEKLRK